MRHSISLREVRPQGWLARVLRRPDREAAAARVWNLLVRTPPDQIQQNAIPAILAETRTRLTDIAADVRQLYRAKLYEACQDEDFTEVEAAELRLVRRLIGVTEAEAAEAAAGVYKSRLGTALADEELSDTKRERLTRLAGQLRLPADVAAAAMKNQATELMQRVLDRAIKDQRLSPEEEAHFRALGQQLGIEPKFETATAAALDRFRLYWRIEQGDLPRLAVPINLKRGEQCHFSTEAAHLERRTVTRAIAYAGPTASIRIAKGVRFRLGAIAPQRISQEVLAELDSGTLYITNRRLLFDGGRQSRTFELSKVINFTAYRDGLNIERDRGKDQAFRFDQEVELAAMILGAVLAEA